MRHSCNYASSLVLHFMRFRPPSLKQKYKLSKTMGKTHFNALRASVKIRSKQMLPKTIYDLQHKNNIKHKQTLTSSSKGIGVLDAWCFADTELLESDLLPEPFPRWRFFSAATSTVFGDSFAFWPVNKITIKISNSFLKVFVYQKFVRLSWDHQLYG